MTAVRGATGVITDRYGHVAAQIAAIAAMLATNLQSDPDTATTGTAVEGLATMARQLSSDLFDLGEV